LADFYFHYTSRTVAQMVIAAGLLRPLGGAVFLTDRPYQSGAEAANELGIPVWGPLVATPRGRVYLTKPVEVVCLIPAWRLERGRLSLMEAADPFADAFTARSIYAGGGRQFRYTGDIDVDGLAWLTLSTP
jgi:hypothetical protein